MLDFFNQYSETISLLFHVIFPLKPPYYIQDNYKIQVYLPFWGCSFIEKFKITSSPNDKMSTVHFHIWISRPFESIFFNPCFHKLLDTTLILTYGDRLHLKSIPLLVFPLIHIWISSRTTVTLNKKHHLYIFHTALHRYKSWLLNLDSFVLHNLSNFQWSLRYG